METQPLFDPFGRRIDYLRISVTDRCNQRCIYCMPNGYHGWAEKTDHLSIDEIVKIVSESAKLGIRKVRITGGEPTIRKDLAQIVKEIHQIDGIKSIGLSTNGSRLEKLAEPLRQAGLRTVNVSLDALEPELYHKITGGNLDEVLKGIKTAINTGFEMIKLNCVLMRNINENQIIPLVQFSAEHGLPLRLIELMPVTSVAFVNKNFLSIMEAMEIISRYDELVKMDDHNYGWGPAKYYRLAKTGAAVGFIGAMTRPHFCETCNKMRLTSDGRLRPCLGNNGEVNLTLALRSQNNSQHLRDLIITAMKSKPLKHDFHQNYLPQRPMTAIGG